MAHTCGSRWPAASCQRTRPPSHPPPAGISTGGHAPELHLSTTLACTRSGYVTCSHSICSHAASWVCLSWGSSSCQAMRCLRSVMLIPCHESWPLSIVFTQHLPQMLSCVCCLILLPPHVLYLLSVVPAGTGGAIARLLMTSTATSSSAALPRCPRCSKWRSVRTCSKTCSPC